MLTVGVYGTAFWADHVHLPGYRDHPEVELVGVCGRRPEPTRALADRFGIAAFGSFDEMLAQVDVVSLAVPPSVQPELATRAAEAGKHLMLEKPLAADLATAERLCAAIEAGGGAAVCFLTRLFVPAVADFMATAPDFGARTAEAEFRSGALLEGSPYATSDWRQDERGVLWDATPHPISVLVQSCGPVTEVTAEIVGRGHVVLTGSHAGGAESRIEVDLADPTTTLTERYRLYRGEDRIDLAEFPYDRNEAFSNAIGTLVARVADGGAAGRDLDLPMHIMRILDAAAASLDHGGRVTVAGAAAG